MLRVGEETGGGQGRGRKRVVASRSRVALCLALFLPAIATPAHAANAQFDLVIVHGRIIDGTGSPWYSGDIGIRNGKITAIGKLDRQSRVKTIDAHDRVVAPGFIDMLGQSELSILVQARLPSKIFHGGTTAITGAGSAGAPLKDSINRADRKASERNPVRPGR